MPLDAAKPVVKRRAAAKQSERGGVDGPCTAVEIEAEQVTQAANPGAVGNFREHALRIEARNEGFRADVMRHVAGGDADRAVGPEVNGSARQSGDEDSEADSDPLAQAHVLRRPRSSATACAAPTDGSACTVTPGGGASSSGTKKSDISGTERSTR